MEPTHDQIAELAYQIYLYEGCPEGRSQEHWLMAEARCWEALRDPSLALAEPTPPTTRKRRSTSRGIASSRRRTAAVA